MQHLLVYTIQIFILVTVKSTSNVTYGNLKHLKRVCVGVLSFTILFFCDVNYKRDTKGRQSSIVILQTAASGGGVLWPRWSSFSCVCFIMWT